MLRDQARVGMRVYFGRPNGQKTLGEILRVNPSKAKVRVLEQRGTHSISAEWSVPYSLMTPATDGDGESKPTLGSTDIVRTGVESLINRYGLTRVLEALKAVTGKEAA